MMENIKNKIKNMIEFVLYDKYHSLRMPWIYVVVVFWMAVVLGGIGFCINAYINYSINQRLHNHEVDVITCHSPIFLTRSEATTENPTDSLDQVWISLYTSTNDDSILFLEKYTRRELRLVNTSCTIQYNVDERSITEYGE